MCERAIFEWTHYVHNRTIMMIENKIKMMLFNSLCLFIYLYITIMKVKEDKVVGENHCTH